ncbi:hypothetical protein QAD02_016695 [Eretmocerus hayati]|uniref:Uncharacterized protein n=1 Tax=Eretmocerus hayati TaxID=131215 RepID=A0ACC2PCV0_9HYME|nr:hypothetical protein QAD02_016695 [Eretmocerus hayati]
MGDRDMEYGERIEYNSSWNGPLKVKRNSTDVLYAKLFLVYLLIWIVVALFVGYFSQNFEYDGIKELRSSVIWTMKSIAWAAVFSFSYVIALRYIPTFIVLLAVIVIGTVLLVFVFLGVSMSLLSIGDMWKYSGYVIFEHWFYIIYCAFFLTILAIHWYKLKEKQVVAIEVVKEAAKVALFFPYLIMMPLIQFSMYILLFGFSGFVYICIIPVVNIYGWLLPKYSLFLVNTLGLYWSINFVNDFMYMTLSGTYASWYWTRNKRFVACCTVPRIIYIIARYHIGTLAYGSLTLPPCLLARQIFGKSRKIFIPCTDSCSNRYFGKMEHNLKYLSHNAYVMTVTHGTNFTQSSKDAFNLSMRNQNGVLVTSKITRGIMLLGIFMILNLIFWGNFIQWRNSKDFVYRMDPKKYAYYTFIIMIILGFTFSRIIMNAFFSLIDIAVETLYLCILEDHERNDGTEQKPFYMKEKLRKLILK